VEGPGERGMVRAGRGAPLVVTATPEGHGVRERRRGPTVPRAVAGPPGAAGPGSDAGTQRPPVFAPVTAPPTRPKRPPSGTPSRTPVAGSSQPVHFVDWYPMTPPTTAPRARVPGGPATMSLPAADSGRRSGAGAGSTRHPH
jgi:hypothetical protein